MPNQFEIHIDKDKVTVQEASLTGAQLRQLTEPPVSPDRDLFLKVPGPTDDELIEDARSVEMKNGLHFYTAPRVITPGTAVIAST